MDGSMIDGHLFSCNGKRGNDKADGQMREPQAQFVSWPGIGFFPVSARLRCIPERMRRIVVTGEVNIMNSVISTS
jgi:hypothetical protein